MTAARSTRSTYASPSPYQVRRIAFDTSVEDASGCGIGPRSNTVTSCPRRRSSMAVESPKTPAPTTAALTAIPLLADEP